MRLGFFRHSNRVVEPTQTQTVAGFNHQFQPMESPKDTLLFSLGLFSIEKIGYTSATKPYPSKYL
jgi:hypothetical protein